MVADVLGEVVAGLAVYFCEAAANVDFSFVLGNATYFVVENAVVKTAPAFAIPSGNIIDNQFITAVSWC